MYPASRHSTAMRACDLSRCNLPAITLNQHSWTGLSADMFTSSTSSCIT